MEEQIAALNNPDLTSPIKSDYERLSRLTVNDLFINDQSRFENFFVQCGDLKIDFSKNKIDLESLHHLCVLAKKSQLKQQQNALFSGSKINNTEERSALHTAFRAPLSEIPAEFSEDVSKATAQLKAIADKISSGEWKGYTNKTIQNVVNIGIGGSDLGPAMTVKALDFYKTNKQLNLHFVSNIDPSDIQTTLAQCNPETTLFIVASKTFTTLETLSNANAAKAWLISQANHKDNVIEKHFVAISTNEKLVKEFGIAETNILPMWDWIGGRYSIWSTIGLSLCIAIGSKQFDQFLEGANKVDEHFKNAQLDKNAPVIMALLSIWYSEYFSTDSHCVLCYDHYLKSFPDYLQQLDMESNGKRVTKQGRPVSHKTGIPVWGGTGSNSQHSFHQLFHQGTSTIPTDFLVGVNSCNPIENQQALLFSNCLAQSQALMLGRQSNQVQEELENQNLNSSEIKALAPHKIIPGDKPSTTIVYEKLSPSILGQLIALYEHKIFTQSVIWNINPFDQWGVELGKQLSGVIAKELDSDKPSESVDPSTAGLIQIFKELKA